MIKLWWSEAEKHNVLPLDDRFGPRFAENAARFHGARSNFTFHAGMGHVPTDVAPDVRSRSYTIEAHVDIDGGDEGVLIAHGDATTGYSLYIGMAIWCTISTSAATMRSSRSDRRYRGGAPASAFA